MKGAVGHYCPWLLLPSNRAIGRKVAEGPKLKWNRNHNDQNCNYFERGTTFDSGCKRQGPKL